MTCCVHLPSPLSLLHLQLDQFFVETSLEALEDDSLNQTHAIIQEVSNPNEISALFDKISYNKVCVCLQK